MSPTGTSNRRWACETRAKSEHIFLFSFVLYSPTRANSVGSPIRDLQFGREVAFTYIRCPCLVATWDFCPGRRTRAWLDPGYPPPRGSSMAARFSGAGGRMPMRHGVGGCAIKPAHSFDGQGPAAPHLTPHPASSTPRWNYLQAYKLGVKRLMLMPVAGEWCRSFR